MKTKLTKMMVLAFSVYLLFIGQASAVEVVGTGSLIAHGSGVASMTGSGRTVLEGSGELIFHDQEADSTIEVTGTGKRFDLGNGTVVYLGFNGKVSIYGTTYHVRLAGADVKMAAHGSGTVILKGNGHYRVEDMIVPFTTGEVIVLNP